MSDDARFDEIIDREARGYREGDGPPADAMWSRIEGDVRRAIQPQRSIVRHWPWLAAGAGVAAALVIGIAIGRSSIRTRPSTPDAVAELTPAPADSARGAQLRALTMRHLVQTEMFLTEVRADLVTGRRNPERRERSRDLLARTRLLMAHDGGRPPSVELLLQDLEMVLAGIAALPDSIHREQDARVIDERQRVGTVLPRIRTLLPAPSTVGGA